jgi:two-component system, chemotaxis family, CheB/CheR fusion protein
MPSKKAKKKRQQDQGRERNPAQESEALNRARAILDCALDCIITMDATGRVREFNSVAERVFGFSRTEAIGEELAKLIIPPRMRWHHRQGLAHYLKTGEGPLLGKRVEIAGMRRDGSEILVELAISPFKIDGSTLFTAYLRDITERKRNEEASRRLAAIVESCDDAIVSTDLKGKITSWNQGAERLFGYKANEVIGKSITILIPPLQRQNEGPAILARIRYGERIDHYETVRRRKDGTLLDVSITFSPIKDERGRVVGASKIARDITERVRSDRRCAAQYTVTGLLAGSQSLHATGPQIIQAIAASGNWVFGSIWLYREEEKMLRCETTWRTGAPWLAVFEMVTRTIPLLSTIGLPGRVFASKKPAWIADVTRDPNFPRKDAAAEAGLRGGFGFPLFAEGTIKGVLELFSPVSVQPDDDLLRLAEALGSQMGLFIHRRKIEGELQRQKETADAAAAVKDRFLATLSSQLRTPLTPILIWAEGTVNQPGLSPEIREGLRMVCHNLEGEAWLLDDLLDLSRLSRGKVALQLCTADVHQLLQRAIDIVCTETEKRHLKLALSCEAFLHILNVDPPRLQQVFWNVLRNACKFTLEHGAVSVRSYNRTPDVITIEISDSGVGIEPEFLEKIFDAFEQVDSHHEGLGLGLAISKAIIEMHGGTISARSKGLGKGATFVIELPILTTDV